MSLDDPKSVPLRFESPPEPMAPVTAVAALRTIRIARGMSLEDVSARLKFAPRVIEAFEDERWEELPSGIGLRTLAKNYTRLLGVEFEALEPILRDHMQVRAAGIANHTSTRSIGEQMDEVKTPTGSIAWVVLILFVVLVLLGIALWQGIIPDSVLPSWLQGGTVNG